MSPAADAILIAGGLALTFIAATGRVHVALRLICFAEGLVLILAPVMARALG